MALSLILALAARQEPVVAPKPVPPFQASFEVAESNRLAINPKLDGVIGDEEWDPLSSEGGTKSYFQWEPGRLYFAATVKAGSPVAISLDLGSNGWLVGNDNYEIRIGAPDTSGQASISSRRLDASNVAGPVWKPFPELAKYSKVVAKTLGSTTTYEVCLTDPNLDLFPIDDRQSMSVRLDTLDSIGANDEPFLPRNLARLNFGFQRAAAMPAGLRWNVEGAGGSIAPGFTDRMRFTFNGDNKTKPTRVTLRSEGPFRNRTTQIMRPFPNFDRKGRAFVDYDNPVPDDAELGWQLVRASVESSDGITGLIQASYRIAPQFDVVLIRQRLKLKKEVQRIRLAYFVRSNTRRRIDGTVALLPSGGIRVLNGNEKRFTISSEGSSVRRVIEVEIPAGTSGTFPLDFVVDLGSQKVTQRTFLSIED